MPKLKTELKLIPRQIFCPRCGEKVTLKPITEPLDITRLHKKGYIAGANGICKCGAVFALVVQPMPKSPTFTLMFDIYKIEKEKGKNVQ